MTDREWRYYLQLSRELNMTRDELLWRMSSAELVDQMSYDTVLQQEREKAERLQKKGMNTKRPRRR